MNLNLVLEMFEELKLQIKQLNISLEKQANKYNTKVAELPFDTFDSPNDNPIEKIREFIEDEHRVLKNMMVSSHNQIYNYQNDVSSEFAEVKRSISEKTHLYHQHNIEFKSPKIIITIVVLFISIVISLTYNIIQLNENKRLHNNDLKYRYIKVYGGLEPEKVHFLEEVFNNDANEEDREKQTNNVIEQENEIQKRARDIEEAINKEEKGKQLIKEAEKLRRPK
jgi:hypothetical protein